MLMCNFLETNVSTCAADRPSFLISQFASSQRCTESSVTFSTVSILSPSCLNSTRLAYKEASMEKERKMEYRLVFAFLNFTDVRCTIVEKLAYVLLSELAENRVLHGSSLQQGLFGRLARGRH
jgi:hypothetical protein